MKKSGHHLKNIGKIYKNMAEAYAKIAAHYAFNCDGCDDNCCTQRFYHYTLAEYYYLMKGIRTVETEIVKKIFEKALKAVDIYDHDMRTGLITNVMCPVNFDGLCSVYEYRPMICRLHGLPHEFMRPDKRMAQGSGCHKFEAANSTTLRLNRTAHYAELALVERQLREEIGFSGRYKKTTAEMLLDIEREIQ